jgi:hypothetical protein
MVIAPEYQINQITGSPAFARTGDERELELAGDGPHDAEAAAAGA